MIESKIQYVNSQSNNRKGLWSKRFAKRTYTVNYTLGKKHTFQKGKTLRDIKLLREEIHSLSETVKAISKANDVSLGILQFECTKVVCSSAKTTKYFL